MYICVGAKVGQTICIEMYLFLLPLLQLCYVCSYIYSVPGHPSCTVMFGYVVKIRDCILFVFFPIIIKQSWPSVLVLTMFT